MKRSIREFLNKSEKMIMHLAFATTAAVGYAALVNVASAAGASADDIAGLITKILGGAATVMGGIRLVTGFVSYANAQDDSNGAEMKKAEGKITAGIILGAVGILVMTMDKQIAGWMKLE